MRDQNWICIGCPVRCSISVSLSDNGEVSEITGNTCKKGEEYARKRLSKSVMRVVTSIVKSVVDVNMVSRNSRRYSKRKKSLTVWKH